MGVAGPLTGAHTRGSRPFRTATTPTLMPQETPLDVVTESCGCAAIPRRVCDVCHSPRHAFVACSGKCLERHLRAVHGEAPLDAEVRARASQSSMSLKSPGTWDAYAHHRRMVMSHVPRRGGAICIFGAGNCADIDLEQLGAAFQSIHLVDIDGDALERARARQPAAGARHHRPPRGD